jgi:hypothetical protein
MIGIPRTSHRRFLIAALTDVLFFIGGHAVPARPDCATRTLTRLEVSRVQLLQLFHA